MRRPPERRKPPARDRRLSGDVLPGGFDTPRDKRPQPKKQARTPGLIPIGPVAAEIVARLHFRRQVERLHRLGPRAVAELLAEIGAERGVTTIIDAKLTRYAAIDPMTLEAASVDQFWPAPLYEITEPPGRPATAQSRATQPHD